MKFASTRHAWQVKDVEVAKLTLLPISRYYRSNSLVSREERDVILTPASASRLDVLQVIIQGVQLSHVTSFNLGFAL